jgi:hypothetical protein
MYFDNMGKKDEWDRCERVLLILDSAICEFGNAKGMVIDENYHNWPDRTLRWHDDIERSISIGLDDEKRIDYRIWVCASEDRGTEMYWVHDYIKRGITAEDLELHINDYIKLAYKKVSAWSRDDLQYGGPIGGGTLGEALKQLFNDKIGKYFK